MKREVLFRVDGGKNIGLGHLVRCGALAEMISSEFHIIFVYKEMPIEMAQKFISLSYNTIKIDDEIQFFQLLKENDIVVLDHYALDSTYQHLIKDRGCKLVCIDDVHDKLFYADLIINHAPNVSQEIYKAQSYTRFALGPKYSLLRQGFLEQARTSRQVKRIKSIFISFGGADPKNLTFKILKEACSLNNLEIRVVTGASYVHLDLLNGLIAENELVSHYNDVNEEMILNLMKSSDLAIVPTSGVFFEALACGCQIIASYYVDNQRKIFDGFREMDVAYFVEDFNQIDSQFLENFILNYQMLSFQNPIDGYSGNRIKNLMENL